MKAVVTKTDLAAQISHTKLSLKVDIASSESKIMKKVTDGKKQLDDKITQLQERLEAMEEGGTSGGNRSGISDTAAANAYVNDGARYRKSVFANKRLGFVNTVLTDQDLWNQKDEIDENGDENTTYWVDQVKMRRILKVKFEIDQKARFRVSKNNNLVFDIKIQARNAKLTFETVAKIMDTRDTLEGITVSLKTPNEFDISVILDSWREADLILKHETMRNGFLCVVIRDGDETLPVRKQNEDDKTFASSCSRILVNNPEELASLDDVMTIEKLRFVASGLYFPFKGRLREFPEDYRKKPRYPGFVNDTWINPDQQ